MSHHPIITNPLKIRLTQVLTYDVIVSNHVAFFTTLRSNWKVPRAVQMPIPLITNRPAFISNVTESIFAVLGIYWNSL